MIDKFKPVAQYAVQTLAGKSPSGGGKPKGGASKTLETGAAKAATAVRNTDLPFRSEGARL